MFFLFYSVAIAFGWETGYVELSLAQVTKVDHLSSGAVNPALDLSGRLMSDLVGYPSTVWSSGGHYFWVRAYGILSQNLS